MSDELKSFKRDFYELGAVREHLSVTHENVTEERDEWKAKCDELQRMLADERKYFSDRYQSIGVQISKLQLVFQDTAGGE